MFDQLRLLCIAPFIALCTMACTAPIGGEEGSSTDPPEDVQVQVVDTPVEPQAGGIVIPGEPTIKLCVMKCEKWCKRMPSGNMVCGESCACTIR